MIDGITSKPFSAETLESPKKGQPYTKEIIEASRKKYGRARKEVEKKQSMEFVWFANPVLEKEEIIL